MNLYWNAFEKYTDFYGRASRTEYWMFILFNLIFHVIAFVLDQFLFQYTNGKIDGAVVILYSLIVFIPSLSIATRRLHDIDKTGWYLFLPLLPIIGSIWLIVLLATEGELEENAYGENRQDELTESEKNTISSDRIIIFYFIVMITSKIFWTVINKFFNEIYFYQSSFFKISNLIFSFIWALFPLVFVQIVKNKSTKTVLFILAIVYALYSLYEALKLYSN
jgi:uncharacterized membrane protein YhaH (DUF805 family)